MCANLFVKVLQMYKYGRYIVIVLLKQTAVIKKSFTHIKAHKGLYIHVDVRYILFLKRIIDTLENDFMPLR